MEEIFEPSPIAAARESGVHHLTGESTNALLRKVLAGDLRAASRQAKASKESGEPHLTSSEVMSPDTPLYPGTTARPQQHAFQPPPTGSWQPCPKTHRQLRAISRTTMSDQEDHPLLLILHLHYFHLWLLTSPNTSDSSLAVPPTLWSRYLVSPTYKSGKTPPLETPPTLSTIFLIEGGLYSVTALRETWTRRWLMLNTKLLLHCPWPHTLHDLARGSP